MNVAEPPRGWLAVPAGAGPVERARIALDRIVAHAHALDGADLDAARLHENAGTLTAAANALDVVASRRRERERTRAR